MEQVCTPLRVLVVEDESLIRWSVSETLVGAGHVVVEAADARAAVQALAEPNAPFDVVLLDFRLPDSSDLRLLATIRRLAPDTAVVLMTAHGFPEVVSAALELGAAKVIVKPFEIYELEPFLQQAYRSRPR
jgi:two-component system KDP operon response regulator KdpE